MSKFRCTCPAPELGHYDARCPFVGVPHAGPTKPGHRRDQTADGDGFDPEWLFRPENRVYLCWLIETREDMKAALEEVQRFLAERREARSEPWMVLEAAREFCRQAVKRADEMKPRRRVGG